MREGSRYAFLFDDLLAVTLCGTFFSVMHFIALLCWCLRAASRKEGVPKNASCCAACNMVLENWFSKRLKAHGCFYCKAQVVWETKSRGFPKKELHFEGNKSFSRAVGFVENNGKWTS